MSKTKLLTRGILTAALAVSVSANAATKKTAKSLPQKKAVAQATTTEVAAAPATAPVAAPATEAARTPAAPEAEVKAELSTATAGVAPRKFSVELESWNFVNVDGANENKADPTSLSSVKIKYQLADSQSVRFVPVFTNSWGVKKDGTGEFTLADPYLQYAHSKIAMLPGDLKLQGAVRAYMGTSEASRNKNQATNIRTTVTVAKDLGKGWELSYNAMPWVYYSTKDTFIDKKGKEQSNQGFRLLHYVELAADLTDKWSFYSDLGLDEVTYKSDIAQPKQYFYAETGLAYQFDPLIKVTGGLSSYWDRDLRAQENQFSAYRTDEMSYFMALNVYL